MKRVRLQPEVWYAATVHRLIAILWFHTFSPRESVKIAFLFGIREKEGEKACNLIASPVRVWRGVGTRARRCPEWSSGKITHPNKLSPQKKSLRICVGGANVLWCYAPRASLVRFPFYRRVSVKLWLTECAKKYVAEEAEPLLPVRKSNSLSYVGCSYFISLVGSWRRAVGGFS